MEWTTVALLLDKDNASGSLGWGFFCAENPGMVGLEQRGPTICAVERMERFTCIWASEG